MAVHHGCASDAALPAKSCHRRAPDADECRTSDGIILEPRTYRPNLTVTRPAAT